MRSRGEITTWKDDQGFGFITPAGGGEQVFVHIKSFANRQRRPVGKESVTYRLTTDARGRARAENVAFDSDRSRVAVSLGGVTASLMLAALFFSFLAVSVSEDRLPREILWLYSGTGAVAFLVYALDKSAARNDRWRTAESTLHFLGLVGGWPGALVAQRVFRHKSKKPSFQFVFWVTVLLNCSALGWLFSAPGAAALRPILGVARRLI